jgi:hypothetical protein
MRRKLGGKYASRFITDRGKGLARWLVVIGQPAQAFLKQ